MSRYIDGKNIPNWVGLVLCLLIGFVFVCIGTGIEQVEREELTAVTIRPVRKPMDFLVVRVPSRVRSWPPARRSRYWPMMFMPNRNRHRPPTRERMSKMSISSPFIKYKIY